MYQRIVIYTRCSASVVQQLHPLFSLGCTCTGDAACNPTLGCAFGTDAILFCCRGERVVAGKKSSPLFRGHPLGYLRCLYHRGGRSASAMGNVQFFWWIFLIITFFASLWPGGGRARYGVRFRGRSVRLGSPGLGRPLGARCSWCYWVNFPLWVASIACMFPSVINAVWGIEFSLGGPNCHRACLCVGRHGHGNAAGGRGRIGSLDGGAVIKVLITAVVGIVGIWFACNNGFANDMSFKTFCPPIWETLTH